MPNPSKRVTQEDRAIGARVREYRLFLRWSQPEFARSVGLSVNQLASVEYGRTPLSYEAAYRLLTRQKLNAHWLATGRDLRDDYFDQSELPSPDTVKWRKSFSEIMAGDVGKVARGLSKIERQRLKNPAILDAIATASGQEYDWLERLQKLLLSETDSTKFKSPHERQHLAQRLYLTLERAINEYHRNQVKAVYQANAAVEAYSLKSENWALTYNDAARNVEDVKAQWPSLLKDITERTKKRGLKALLAHDVGVAAPRINEWLRETGKPTAEVALKLRKLLDGGWPANRRK